MGTFLSFLGRRGGGGRLLFFVEKVKLTLPSLLNLFLGADPRAGDPTCTKLFQVAADF